MLHVFWNVTVLFVTEIFTTMERDLEIVSQVPIFLVILGQA
jgi:hypothetical protein